MNIIYQSCYFLALLTLLSKKVLTFKLMLSQCHLFSIIWTNSHLMEHQEKSLTNQMKCFFRFRPCRNINMSSFFIKLLRQGTPQATFYQAVRNNGDSFSSFLK